MCQRKTCVCVEEKVVMIFFFFFFFWGGGWGGGWSLILSSTIGCESFFVLSCKSFSLQIY